MRLLWVVVLLAGVSCGNKSGGGIEATGEPLTGVVEIDELTRQIQADPKKAALYYLRAVKNWEHDRLAAAQADAQKAIDLDPARAEHYMVLADAYIDDAKSRQALGALNRGLLVNPKHVGLLLKLSEYQMILRQHEESVATAKKILADDATNADAYFLLGMNAEQLGDTLGALNFFQSCVERDPDNVDAYIVLGKLSTVRNRRLAEKYFANALRPDTTDYHALFAMAYFYHQTDQLDKAAEYYRKVIILHPQEPDPQQNLGLLYLERNQLEEAFRHFNMCIKIDATNAACYYYRGVVHEARKRRNEAVADYRQALVFDPGYENAREALTLLGEKL
jgi:tetratricopeptide (TPR) repeat protein